MDMDLIVPSSPEMVRVVRLTVSGIASTMGFAIDMIEDIKVAVAEICNGIIKKSKIDTDRYIIRFNINDEKLSILFLFENQKPEGFELFNKDDMFGISIVNALVDEVILNDSEENEIITLAVSLKENTI